jgi:hypothetical protein
MPASTFTLTLPHTSVSYSFTLITQPEYAYIQDPIGSILTSKSFGEDVEFTANVFFLAAINAEVPYTFFAYENNCTDPANATYRLLLSSKQLIVSVAGDMDYYIPVVMTELKPIASLVSTHMTVPAGPRILKPSNHQIIPN